MFTYDLGGISRKYQSLSRFFLREFKDITDTY